MARPNPIELEEAFSPMYDAVRLWAVLIVVSLVSVLYVGYNAERVLNNEVRTLAEKSANLSTILVDENAHAQFARDGKKWSAQHKALIQPLLEFHQKFPDAARIRTVVQEGGRMLIILDTESFAGEVGMDRPVDPQSPRSPMSDADNESDLARSAIAQNGSLVEAESDPGPFGDFLTAAAPLGGGGAVLATVDVTTRRAAQRRIIDVVLVGCAISLVVATVIAAGFFNIRSSYIVVASAENEARRGKAWEQARNQRVVLALGQMVLHRDLENDCLLWSGDPSGVLGTRFDSMPLRAAGWEERLHPEDLDGLRKAVATPRSEAHVFEVEYRVRAESGNWVWFNERGVVSFSQEGTPIAVDSVLLDITEKKNAAERLDALALIASRTDNAVCLMQPDGSIDWVNDAFERVTGYTREDSLHRLFQEIVGSAGASANTVRTMLCTAASLQSQVAELELLNKEKSPYWAHLEIQPLTDASGQITKLVAIQSDRTAGKEFESRLVRAKDAAEAADRAKSEFLAVMSHEVRTPLNAVIGFTSLLLDSPLSEQQRDYLRTIHSSGESLLSLVNDILDFSRMEADKFILEKTHFDLRESIEGTLDLLGVAAARKGLELICDLASETPPMMYGDQARLRQVVLNLAGNAVKFTETGEVLVSVRVVGRQGDNMRLRFEVRDTGPGIDLGQQLELFKPFSQADSTATRKYGGTGLGLAISKRLVKLMGGDIGLESSPGNGSTFWFELPTVASSDRDLDFAGVLPLRGQSVILVEQNTSLRAVITNQLTRWGMQVKGFARGRDAVFAAEQRRFDVAIIDTNTKDIDGIRLAERLRRVPRGGVDRILLMEMPGQESIDTSMLPGIVQAIRKPIRMGNLAEILLRTTPDSHANLAAEPQAPQAVAEAIIATGVPLAAQALPRVLVADDNAINRKLVAKMLAKLGFECAMAENGREAVSAVESSHFDAVLMDLQMPEMDGLEATRQIRKRGFLLPIIAITADVMPDDEARCAAAGMNDYLSKPVRATSLEASLNNALGRVTV